MTLSSAVVASPVVSSLVASAVGAVVSAVAAVVISVAAVVVSVAAVASLASALERLVSFLAAFETLHFMDWLRMAFKWKAN